jgi:6-phosphogluconolactonase
MAIERTAKSLSDRVLANHNVDTRRIHTRTFALDPSGNILIATNIMELPVRNAKGVSVLPASLAVFRARGDGKLDFVRKYDVAVGSRNMFWMGITALP